MRPSHPDFHRFCGPYSEIGRPMCYTCVRPHNHCLCGLVEPFEAHCNILVLQHPNERKKYYSTTKLVRGAIKNSKVLYGIEFEEQQIAKALSGTQPYILYPSPTAVDCASFMLDSKATVIVIDGTWDEAGKIVYRNPALKTFPCLTFSQPLRSNYRIRKQPRAHYLSTVESVAHLLKLNATTYGMSEKCDLYDRLLSGFTKMVDRQLTFVPKEVGAYE